MSLVENHFLYFTILIYFTYFLYNSNSDYSCFHWIGITTSSNNHFKVSINLILSFFITHPNSMLIYYDMNLDLFNKRKLKDVVHFINQYLVCNEYKGVLLIEVFNFSLYPKHFTPGNYNWKPVMVYDTLIKYKRIIFWLDAGVELTLSVKKEIDLARKYDIYMPYSKYKLLDWTPVKITETMKVNRDLLNKSNAGDTGYFVIKYCKYMMENIIKKWIECAYNPMCICPPGSSRKNSRYEQSTLLVLLYLDKKYKGIIETFKTYDNHKQQCDHRNDCNLTKKINIIKKYTDCN